MPNLPPHLLNLWWLIPHLCLLLFGIWVPPTSARPIFDSLEENCSARKAYAVVIKLLAVYASHIITIKLRPGIGTWKTFQSYLMAGLLPSASISITLMDLMARRSKFNLLKDIKDVNELRYYENMQNAINAGAACFRTDSDRLWSGPKVSPNISIRAKPLNPKEIFVMIPRGTSARLFRPIMVEGGSQLIKALVGAIQLVFATFQLISTNNPKVSAYGYGSFVYTIIPYAFGSLINLIGALMTNTYSDLTEMELSIVDNEPISSSERAERGHPLSTTPSQDAVEVVGTQNISHPHPTPIVRTDLEHPKEEHSSSDDAKIHLHPEVTMASEKRFATIFSRTSLLLIASYLAIVGAISRFRNGISTQAQRGWFLSWGIVGILYGLILSMFDASEVDVIICRKQDEATHTKIRQKDSALHRIIDDVGQYYVIAVLMTAGSATIGGIIAMVQQYLHIYEC
jgi:hypothetical protein